MNSYSELYRTQLVDTLGQIDTARVEQIIELFRQARDENRHIFVCGNGGSAASASHFTCDVLKGASFGREKRFRMLALGDNQPTVTAYSNDVSYDAVFVEQLKNFAQPGDLVMGISGSGNSPNVLRAFEYANEIGCKTVALTGRDGGKLGKLAQVELNVPDQHMGRIEDAHMIVCHMIAYSFMERP